MQLWEVFMLKKYVVFHNPRVGLLNIGTEEGKGNELTKAALRTSFQRARLTSLVM